MRKLYTLSNTVVDATLMWERRPDIAGRCVTHVTEMMCVKCYVHMCSSRPVVAVREHSCLFVRVHLSSNMIGIDPYCERQRVEGCEFKEVGNTAPASGYYQSRLLGKQMLQHQ